MGAPPTLGTYQPIMALASAVGPGNGIHQRMVGLKAKLDVASTVHVKAASRFQLLSVCLRPDDGEPVITPIFTRRNSGQYFL